MVFFYYYYFFVNLHWPSWRRNRRPNPSRHRVRLFLVVLSSFFLCSSLLFSASSRSPFASSLIVLVCFSCLCCRCLCCCCCVSRLFLFFSLLLRFGVKCAYSAYSREWRTENRESSLYAAHVCQARVYVCVSVDIYHAAALLLPLFAFYFRFCFDFQTSRWDWRIFG